MGSVSEMTNIILEDLDINPSCLGQFANIFKIYERVFELEDNIHCFDCKNCLLHDGKCFQVCQGHSQWYGCQPWLP